MARYQDVIYLVKETQGFDEIGNEVFTTEEHKVYANRWRGGERGKTAVSGQSDTAGLIQEKRDERRYEMLTADYNGEEKARVQPNGDLYEVASDWRGDKTLLHLSRVEAPHG